MASLPVTVATAFSAGNALLLSVLASVWIQNYRTFRTPLIMGLLVFSLVFLLENLVAVYFFFGEGYLYGTDPHVQQVVMVLRALQFVALVALSSVTLR